MPNTVPVEELLLTHRRICRRNSPAGSFLNIDQSNARVAQTSVSVSLSHRLEEPLIEFDVLRESTYREAVTKHSPGLRRFAATLGTELCSGRNPNGVVAETDFLPQGSRAAPQPWAVCFNRFAVMRPRIST